MNAMILVLVTDGSKKMEDRMVKNDLENDSKTIEKKKEEEEEK